MLEDAVYRWEGRYFVWNVEKARRNLAKHGVSFQEAAQAFTDPLAMAEDDPDHSEQEKRKILIGHSDRGLLVVVVHTDRGNLIRLISARGATRREKKKYEEAE